jgi:hypothetical protein
MNRRSACASFGLLVLVALAVVTLIAATTGSATLSPSSATFTLRAGDPVLGVATETKTAGIPAKPPSADVEIAIDTTGSMQPSINQAKADAVAIVTGVQGSVPDTQFAVVQFKDFCTTTSPTSGPGCTNPGDGVYAGDYPEYAVVQTMTSNATSVQNAINGLSADGGGDAAEAYNLVFHNSYTPSLDGAIGWRPGTRKFVVVIGDAQPHGAGSSGFPGCTDTTADPHGLNTATEIAGMAAAQRTLLMIRQVSSRTTVTLACYQSLAAAGFSGGQAVDAGGSLATQIVSLINAAFANVNDVHLEVVSAGPAPASASWITLPPAIGPVPAPSTQNLGTLTVKVPAGTPAGTYTFDIRAVADGIDIGHQTLTIIVPQKMLTLTPATATNPIGTSHTVTAHVFDVLGPYVGDTVLFSVTSGPAAVPSSGSGTTNAAGTTQFTFSNTPPNLGTNTIVATDGSLSASATKTWAFPESTPGCKVTGGGRIKAANGDKATFGGNAFGTGPRGQEEYQDHGPGADINVHSISVEAVTCSRDGTSASIFGFATIDGVGSYVFRIDLQDLGEPGAATDHYRIRLSSGYDSGDQLLSGGNIQIH